MDYRLLLDVFVLIVVPIGAWLFNITIVKRFNELEQSDKENKQEIARVSELLLHRMDENKESFWRNFVSKEKYEENLVHIKEMMEQRHNSLEKLISEKLETLAGEIRSMREQMKKQQ